MKKMKKLVLKPETVVRLTPQDLQHVVGGEPMSRLYCPTRECPTQVIAQTCTSVFFCSWGCEL